MATSSVKIDSSGNSITFWLKHIGSIDVVQASTTSSFPGTWSVPVNVSSLLVSARIPSLASNLNGDAVLGWVSTIAPNISNIFVSIRPISTGIWSAPFQLVNVGSTKSLVTISLNETGQITAQWVAYTDGTFTTAAIYAATATVASGTWSAVQRVSL